MLDRQNEPLGPNAEDDVATLARKVDFLSRSDSYNLGARNSHRARDVYLGVVPLSVTTTGYAIGGSGEPERSICAPPGDYAIIQH